MPMVAVATGRQRARSFGAQADLYDRLRPSYPADLVTAVLPADAHRVADIGAGTGKLAALLHECGLAVTAVEPDPAMRAVLAERVPAADVRIGVGESLPLADADVDAVLYGQAWHWVDPDRAANEARRVLRADGTLGLLWNMHDDRVEHGQYPPRPRPGPGYGRRKAATGVHLRACRPHDDRSALRLHRTGVPL